MGKKTDIQWCDSTNNPQMGCEGCELVKGREKPVCYAKLLTDRWAGVNKGWPAAFNQPRIFMDRIPPMLQWSDLTGSPRIGKEWLDGMPRLIFLNDMGDTFSTGMPKDWFANVIQLIKDSPHQYLVLSKWPHRFAEFSKRFTLPPNVWPGTSVTMQKTLFRAKHIQAVQSNSVKWVKDNLSDQYEIVYVFSNTGKEREETLVFNERCAQHFGINLIWIEAVINNKKGKGVRVAVTNFKKACRNGEPFEALIIKFGLPNRNNSHCSRDLKGEAIKAYCRSIGWKKHYTAIGIRFDEPGRLNWKTAKKNRLIYPLATMVKCTKSDIAAFWSQQPFDLELKSYEGNCDLCWKKSFRKLMTITIENPQLADWWREMERKYENHLGESRKLNQNIKLPMRFFRGRWSVDDIIEESRFPFEMAIDESKDIDKDKLLSSWNEELDGNFGCVESCEAF